MLKNRKSEGKRKCNRKYNTTAQIFLPLCIFFLLYEISLQTFSFYTQKIHLIPNILSKSVTPLSLEGIIPWRNHPIGSGVGPGSSGTWIWLTIMGRRVIAVSHPPWPTSVIMWCAGVYKPLEEAVGILTHWPSASFWWTDLGCTNHWRQWVHGFKRWWNPRHPVVRENTGECVYRGSELFGKNLMWMWYLQKNKI